MKKLFALLITLSVCCITSHNALALGGEDCSTAVPIGGLPYQDLGNICSSLDNYDANCGLTFGGGFDVVYSYTPAVNEVVDVTLCNTSPGGTNFDSRLFIFSGSCVSFTEIACSDDACYSNYFLPYVSNLPGINMTGGTTYYIVVDGWSNTDCGDYQLDVSMSACPPGTPVHDDCTGAVPLALTNGVPASEFGTTCGATADGCNYTMETVWHAVTLSGSCNNLTIDWCGTASGIQSNNTWIIINPSCPQACFGDIFSSGYDNTTCGDGNWTIHYNFLPAGTYWIPVLAGGGNSPGNYQINFLSIDCPPPPPNDDCSAAVPVALSNGVPVTEFGDWTGATPDCGYYTYPTVWHAVTLPNCMNLTVDYCGNATGVQGNTWIIINPSCPLTCYGDIFNNGYDNTTCGDGNWSVYYYNLAAGTYYIPVMGDYSGYNYIGAYQVTFTGDDCPPPPVNDDPCGAIVVNCGDVVSGSTLGATPDYANLPGCYFGYSGAPGVWYKIAGTGGSVIASLCGGGTNYDSRLDVYDDGGTAVCFPLVNCDGDNDDFCGLQSELTFATSVGTDYYILVNGWLSGNVGNFTLTMTCCGSTPVNDDCSGAVPVTLVSGVPVTEFGDGTCSTPDGGYYTYPTVWHAVTLTGSCNNLTVDWCGTAPGIMDQNAWIIINPSCPLTPFGDTFASSYDNTTCGDGNWTINYNYLAPGTWYIGVLVGLGNTPGPYTINMVSVDCPPPPPNDDCSGATPVVLTNGVPVTEFGDNTGATPDCGYYTMPTVWHAVTLPNCMDLRIDYCGNVPGRFGDAWIIINPSCPITCFGDIFASNFNNTDCGDGNWTVNYTGLAAGTYYVPILSEEPGWNTPGPYQVTMTGFDCPPPPPNDNVCNAIDVTQMFTEYTLGNSAISCFDIMGYNNAATMEAGEPLSCSIGFQHTIWYRFTAPSCGQFMYDLTTDNSGTLLSGDPRDTQLQLLHSPNGSCDFTQMVIWGCDDDNSSADCDDASSGIFASTLDDGLLYGNTAPLLMGGETYYIQVDGWNGSIGTINLTLSILPAAPTAALGTPTSTQIVTTWPNTGANNYDTYLIEIGQPGYASNLNDPDFTKNWSNLMPSTQYGVQTKNACQPAGTENFFTPITTITTDVSTCPGWAVGPSCDAQTVNSLTFSWSAQGGALHYKLRYRIPPQNGFAVINNVMTTSYTLTGLLSGTTYEFWVQAVCVPGGGAGANPTSPHTFCTTLGVPRLANPDEKDTDFEYDFNGTHYVNWDPARLNFDVAYDYAYVDISSGQLLILEQNGLANNVEVKNFNIYPNPASSNATLELTLSSSGDVTISVYDIQGKLVKSVIVNSSSEFMTYTMSLDDMSSGMYNIVVETDGDVQTQKLAVIK